MISERLLFLQQRKNHATHWNISWSLGVVLSQLVYMYKPKRILEIGTSNGFSTLWLAKFLSPESKIITLEIDVGRFEEAKTNFSISGCTTKIEQRLGDVFEIITNETFEPFDFIFLDAAHKRYKEVIELLQQKKLLTSNVLIVCDNIISHAYMTDFVSWMNLAYSCQVIDMDSGFLVAKVKKQ